MQLTEEEQKLASIFQPRLFNRVIEALNEDKPIRFVHYTNADAAMSIIKQKKIWMRKSSCMNDFMEVQHGLDCLSKAYNKTTSLKNLLDELFEGLSIEIETLFNGWQPALLNDTYLTCLSEHLETEDKCGRLSMWRAYSNTCGVALVLNGTQVLDPKEEDDIEGVYAGPVDYYDGSEFESEFLALIENIKLNSEFLQKQNRQTVTNYVFNMLKFAAVSTKNSGFKEEREWRVFYCPQLEEAPDLEKEIVSISGEPQPIYKIPLKNINALLNRVIIGPSEFGDSVKEAFVHLLEKAGVSSPEQKVTLSNIPLRR